MGKAVLAWVTTSYTVFLYGMSAFLLVKGTWLRPEGIEPTVCPALLVFAMASILLAKDLSHLLPEPIYKDHGWLFLPIAAVVLIVIRLMFGDIAFGVAFTLALLLAYL